LVVTWDPTNPNSYGINLENYGVTATDRDLLDAIREVQRMRREGGGGR
jgi:hypothetical protein